jgi:A/G-specific adenine glycosylase
MQIDKLIHWSKSEFPHLPWRQNRSLYRTLVSEIMLQQTTVGTVKNHYERFLQEFPDLKSLALASEEELLVAWKGLGYYRRAKNLKKISEALYNDHDGKFPDDLDALQKISGIGPYTASALLAIGMDKPALAVDANLERVIARLYGLKEEKGLKLQKKIRELFAAGKIFSDKKISYRGLNEALMDLGRTFCQSRKASCELCPLRSDCLGFKSKKPLQFPIEKNEVKKPTQEHELHLLRVIVQKDNKILAYKKTEGQWLSGQYEIPTLLISSTDKKLIQYPQLKVKLAQQELIKFKTGITKYSITNFILMTDQKELKRLGFAEKLEWREMSDKKSNLSTASMKALAKITTGD